MLENDDELDIEPNEVLDQEPPTSDDYEAPKPEEEDEKEAYSRRVQKRIDKLTYERNIERQRREQIEAKLAEQEERLQRLAEAQQKHFEDLSNKSIESEQAELKQRRRDALEIGDYDTVNEIDDQLLEIKVKAKQPKREPPAPAPRAPEQPVDQTPQAMQHWLQANDWTRDPQHSARLDKADAIYRELVSKGYDPEDQELYDEIDKRLKRTPPPPGNGPDRGQITGSDKGVFTAEDKRAMENWGLDPNNPAARKEWIKQKAVNYG